MEEWFGAPAQQRIQSLEAAAVVLTRWINHLIAQGLGRLTDTQQQAIAITLNDLQASALARRVRELPFAEAQTSQDWEEILEQLALMRMWALAMARRDLPEPFLLSLLQWGGMSIRRERLLAQVPAQASTWYVWGRQSEALLDGLRLSRTWLQCTHTRRWAVLMDFAHGQAPLPNSSLDVGMAYDASLHFYPAAFPLRAILSQTPSPNTFLTAAPQLPRIADFLIEYADALTRWPWLEQMPFALDAAYLTRTPDGQFWLLDTDKSALPLSNLTSEAWQLLAFGQAKALQIMGEWNGKNLYILSARRSDGQSWCTTGKA